MVQVGFAHHIGTFLLFVSSILLIVTTITAPVVSNISMLYVDLGTSSITYGTFGYCVQGVASGSVNQSPISFHTSQGKQEHWRPAMF